MAKEWVKGYAAAVVNLIRLNKEVDTRTKELFYQGLGNHTLKTLEGCGIDESDMLYLKKYWKELN